MEQLLAVAHLDARTMPPLETADLGRAAAETVAFLAPLAVARGFSIALERPVEPVMVRGDAVLIGDLVRNLVDNALAVSPRATEVTIVIDGGGRLSVVDQRPGIMPVHRGRVFERFWRAPDAPAGGSGLGLTEIAGWCGATASISEAQGGGAVFSVGFARS